MAISTAPIDTASFMQKRREELEASKADAQKRKAVIDDEIAGYDRELKGFLAFERAMSEKPATPRASKSTGTRKGGRADQVLAAIKAKPDGISRADLIAELGAADDKKEQAAISQALMALKKKGDLSSPQKGFYTAAA